MNVQKDRANCGACAQACDGDQMCQGGACVGHGCKGDETLCGLLCVATTTDEANCGDCGLGCLLGEKCMNGKCVPP